MLSKCIKLIIIISYLRFFKLDIQTKLNRWLLFLDTSNKFLLLGIMLFSFVVCISSTWALSLLKTERLSSTFTLALHLDSVLQKIKCCPFWFCRKFFRFIPAEIRVGSDKNLKWRYHCWIKAESSCLVVVADQSSCSPKQQATDDIRESGLHQCHWFLHSNTWNHNWM